MKYLLFLLPMSAWCVTIPIKILGTTSTQVAASYTATTAGACTVAVSEGASIGTLVYDIDPALFSGSDSDERTGNVFSGTSRKIVVGQRKYQFASDGLSYSRALQTNTLHTLRVTCGSDSGTVSFTTANVPIGGAAPDVPPFDSSSFGNYGAPSIDFSVNSSGSQDKTYIDAMTGLQMKRGTSPYDTLDASATNRTFASVVDTTSAWTTPNNILGNSGVATYAGSGTTSAYLFLQAHLTGSGSGFNAEQEYVDAKFHINGSGDNGTADNRKLSICVTQDHGQTCQGATVDLQLPLTTPAVVAYPSNYPSLIWKEWVAASGLPPSMPNIVTRSGNVSVTGTAVTLNSGDRFQDMVSGDVIVITGTDPDCPSDICTVASITNATHMVITQTVTGTVTAAYSADNFGWKIWKKTATGSVSVNTAQFDPAVDSVLQMPDAGAYSQCSLVDAPTTVDRSGTPLGHIQHGNLCVQLEMFGNTHLWWNGTNGEVRLISLLVRPAVASPAADITTLDYLCQQYGGAPQLSPFDQTNANILYCSGTKTGSPAMHDVMYKCTYDPANGTWGNYVEFTDYTIQTSNPAVTCVNTTKASLGNDLNTQGVPSGLFLAAGNTSGSLFSIAPLAGGQNGRCYYVRFNTTTNLVEFVHDSWTTYPRWSGCHGTAGVGISNGGFFVAPLVYPSTYGAGQYQVPITAIAGRSDTSLTTTYVDSSTCETLGVTNPTFIAQGATGNNCISITVTGQPYDPTPAVAEYTAYPWPKNSTACFGDNSTANCWAQLQNAIEGDFIIDASSGGFVGEQFRLVKIVSSTTWILQRFASQADCSSTQQQAHNNGWTPLMIPAGMCSAVSYYFDNATNTSLGPDRASMNSSHNDFLAREFTCSTNIFAQSGYNLRVGCNQIGQPATYNSVGTYQPLFAGSTAAMIPSGIQSHPSARQWTAAPPEFRWLVDGRPYGGAGGGVANIGFNVVTTTTQTGVYKVTNLTNFVGDTNFSTLDRKRLPVQAWAGRYLLQDKSGPGSTLLTADTWKFCVADFAGECFATSSAGDVFMNVPQADTAGACNVGFEVNTPCWASAAPQTPYITQVGVDKPDPIGTYWRRLPNFFNGIGWTDNFWNARPLPDASWMFSYGKWINGVRTEVVMAKLPPWPAQDTIQRNTFVPITIQLHTASAKVFKARFGYDTNLYCTSRLEQCATMGTPTGSSPFQWVSEGLTGTSINGSGSVTIPAISGRVLYYVLDNVTDGTSGPMQVVPVP